jgi:hypothetical protein
MAGRQCSHLRNMAINRGRTDDSADLAHRFADGIEERPAGVLHQMPTIRDLYRVRQGLCCGFAIYGCCWRKGDVPNVT